MIYFDDWYEHNIFALKHLYDELIKISKSYGIIINNNQKTINSFIKMMYNESDGKLVNYNLYPEFFSDYDNS
jgi:hypothetical protein